MARRGLALAAASASVLLAAHSASAVDSAPVTLHPTPLTLRKLAAEDLTQASLGEFSDTSSLTVYIPGSNRTLR